METFKYLNWNFIPIRKFKHHEDTHKIMRSLTSFGFSNYKNQRNEITDKWNYNDFYKAAAKVGAGLFDIFQMEDGKMVIPCTNELFEYSTN